MSNMTAESLEKQQKEIDLLVEKTARKANLITDKVEPIWDGIANPEGYLRSRLKVAWVLKEAYDDFDENGDNYGGNFSLLECYDKPDAWRNKVWQRIAYVMYGFLHDLWWDNMDYIYDNHEMINVIRDIAMINISKMPGKTVSSLYEIEAKYNTVWREVILKQLDIYAPDVIIFGNTFECFRRDPLGNRFQEAQLDRDISFDSNWGIDYFRLGGQRLISAYHPGRKDGSYVDGLISALQQAERELIPEIK